VINSEKKGRSLLVWDADGLPPVGDWTVVFWSGFADSSAAEVVSIPRLVETHAEDMRSLYLAWIYELGETRIQGRRVVDDMELRPDFSYWWMTLFSEKCNYSKSPQITDAVRLIAFDKWASGRSIDRVVLASMNRPLAECMRSWCAQFGYDFVWQHEMKTLDRVSWFKRLYQRIPHHLQALIWLARHLLQRWKLRGVGVKDWQQTRGQVTIVSYLDNLIPDAAREGRFESRYWANLPDFLQRDSCKTNWLHLYAKDAFLTNTATAVDIIRKFNETGLGEQTHVTLDSFLSVKVVIRTLHDWYRLVCVGRRLKQGLSLPPDSGFDLWPLFEEDWQRSMFGTSAMNNALFLNLFDSAFKSLPKQRVGVYLQENQGWEFALSYAWKSKKNGLLIGAPHSTIRFWDLRFFFDPRSYLRSGKNILPLPDRIAYNGPAALDAYLKAGYPRECMVEVEALRFLHLCDARVDTNTVSLATNDSIRVLVLADYLLINTQQQLYMLEKAMELISETAIITLKPHPNSPVNVEDYPRLKMSVTSEPVSKLLARCDVSYTSSVTSAAVDAYCAGVPVVSVFDPNNLNQSPLRGLEGVLYACTPEELASALISAASRPRLAAEQQYFFTLDPKLPRWRKLLLEVLPE